MNAKTFFIRFAGLIVIAAAGSFLYAVTFNALQKFGFIHSEMADQAFASVLTMKATYVWMFCVTLAFISIFIKDSWRYVLYTSPLYAPSLLAIIFTLLQK